MQATEEEILDSEARLSRYADVLVHIGLRVEPGDRLLIESTMKRAVGPPFLAAR
ncbi:MAG: hypothetical protein ACC658_13455 [Acidimicrobiia bacterium]